MVKGDDSGATSGMGRMEPGLKIPFLHVRQTGTN